ncbi:helix-turn-helix domain-containing protein [Streptomyces sp. NPDC056632]|uniref:helix-turn-helix domain-containing protein n=1 Tax=Streptomyces sp. NPDC056632 TaxID=3345884 RepID=UPI0036C15D98
MTTPTEVAQRRAAVRRLAAQDLSNRAIAEQLGISKDTVARDLRAPALSLRQLAAERAAQTDAAVRQACAAAQGAADARPAYVITDEDTARRWHGDLRAAAAQLLALADQFTDYYLFARSETSATQDGDHA